MKRFKKAVGIRVGSVDTPFADIFQPVGNPSINIGSRRFGRLLGGFLGPLFELAAHVLILPSLSHPRLPGKPAGFHETIRILPAQQADRIAHIEQVFVCNRAQRRVISL